jgi:nucleotide-binding universal stress UspA family protein
MYRHLLVPLDGSPLAESALPAAVRIAGMFGAEVTLLHVLEVRPPSTVHGAKHLADAGEAEAYLSGVEDWLRERGVPVAAHVHTPGMEPARGVAEHARELGVDLVVLCAHGGRGVRGLLHGRLGQQVVADARVPVLIVPTSSAGREAEWRCRRILVVLGDEAGGDGALERAAAFARAAGASLRLVQVVATAETVGGDRRWPARLLPGGAAALLDAESRRAAEILERRGGELEGQGLDVSAAVERGEEVEGIVRAARRFEADLLVLGTRGISGLAAVWGGSVAARLVERFDGSFLLAPRAVGQPEARG